MTTMSEALAELEANRDIWQEVLDGVREIKGGGGKPSRQFLRREPIRGLGEEER